ncbi:hypothetical protein BaRGS_00028634, partial [Batillaria attramentaria]
MDTNAIDLTPRRLALSRIPPSLLAKCKPGVEVNFRPTPIIGGQTPRQTRQETIESHFLTLRGPEHVRFRAARHRSFVKPRMSSAAFVTTTADVRYRYVVP